MLCERIEGIIKKLIGERISSPQQDIYNIKSIIPYEKESCSISLRFKNTHGIYFILSLTIQLKDNFPINIIQLHQLTPKRYFFKPFRRHVEFIPTSKQLSGVLSDPAIKTYFNLRRYLPDDLLLGQYDIIAPKLKEFINEAEEVSKHD